MRATFALGALVVALATINLHSVKMLGEDPSTGAKNAPTEEAVTDLVGERLVKLFDKFGTPVDLYCYRGSSPARDSVTLDYSTFGFDVREKIVRACRFWPEWKGTVKGIKIGATRDEVVKKLGDKFISDMGDDGSETLSWNMKDPDMEFVVDFDKDHKSYLARVRMK